MHFVVPIDSSPMKIKDFVCGKCQISLTHWRRIKRLNLLRINGQLSDATAIVRAGDVVDIRNTISPTLVATDIPLTILYEDPQFLAVAKPAGMLVHPVREEQTESLANAVQHYYLRQNFECAFHPVLRLDRNTSGIVLVAKSSLAHHRLEQRPPRKIYLALCAGIPTPLSGLIDVPIAREPGSIIKRCMDASGQSAQTLYETLSIQQGTALIGIQLLTGRTHQIRAHMAHIGCPLIGDDLYGGPTELLPRQALHACRIDFYQPFLQKIITIRCPLPNDLRSLLTQLGYTDAPNDKIYDIIKGDIELNA